MPQPNDLSRSLVALDHNSTIIAVVELSQSSWLVGGGLPGIERQPRNVGARRRAHLTEVLSQDQIRCDVAHQAFIHPIKAETIPQLFGNGRVDLTLTHSLDR